MRYFIAYKNGQDIWEGRCESDEKIFSEIMLGDYVLKSDFCGERKYVNDLGTRGLVVVYTREYPF